MAHFNRRNNRQQQGGRGMQGGNAPRLPEAFDKGELIEGLVFSTVPARNGGTFVAAILTDGTLVEPGCYNEYRFKPVLDEKAYYCSVMGGNGKWSALPVHYRELSADEWVREQPQRACLTAVLIFEMSDERHSGRTPRPISRHFDGRTVLVERGHEDRVQLGVETRVSLIEPRNANNSSVLFAIPLATPAAKPVPQEDVEEMAKPEHPADPLKVTLRSFERKQGGLVRSMADLTVRERQMSIYDLLSDGQHGIRTTAQSSAQVVRANANKIADALEARVHKNTPRILQEKNVFARIDAMGEAVKRALAALGVQDAKSDGATENGNVQAEASDGSKPKRRNRKRKNRNGRGRDGQGAQAPVSGNAQRNQGNQSGPAKPNVVRAQGTATLGDAIGDALTRGIENVPRASQPTVAPEPEVNAPTTVDSFDNANPAELIADGDSSADDDVIVPPEAPAPEAKADQFEAQYPGMARELSTTVEVLKAAIAKSGLGVVDFSEKPKKMKMYFVHQVQKSEKSA